MNSNSIIALAEILADHQGVTHWAISNRIFGNGNFFARLKEGKNCWHSSVEKAHRWFGANWPDDLVWPDDIAKPDKRVDQDQAA